MDFLFFSGVEKMKKIPEMFFLQEKKIFRNSSEEILYGGANVLPRTKLPSPRLPAVTPGLVAPSPSPPAASLDPLFPSRLTIGGGSVHAGPPTTSTRGSSAPPLGSSSTAGRALSTPLDIPTSSRHTLPPHSQFAPPSCGVWPTTSLSHPAASRAVLSCRHAPWRSAGLEYRSLP